MSHGQFGTGDTSLFQQAEVKQTASVAPLVTRSNSTPTTTTKKPDRNHDRKPRPIVDGVLPEDDDERKSITLEGFLFKRDGVGWECRSVVYVEDEATKKQKRKRPYLAHLSRTNYEEMKRKNTTADTLTVALVRWAKAKKKEKGR